MNEIISYSYRLIKKSFGIFWKILRQRWSTMPWKVVGDCLERHSVLCIYKCLNAMSHSQPFLRCPPKNELVLKPFWLLNWLGRTFWPTVAGYVCQGAKLRISVHSLDSHSHVYSNTMGWSCLGPPSLCIATSQSGGRARAAAYTTADRVQLGQGCSRHVPSEGPHGAPCLGGFYAPLLPSWKS